MWDNYGTYMTKIIPIRDLKNTTKISEMCHESNEPIFITKNGYDDMVIMSSETYEKMNAYDMKSNSLRVEDSALNYIYETKYTINEIRKVLSPIFETYNVKSAILFGSYARNEATEKSDIDIVVDSGLKGLKFFGLVNDVVESLRVKADVFDVREIKKNSPMEKEIKKEGIKIYGE